MPPRKQKPPSAPTTAQRLGGLLKSARNLMRKDKGLNGDLDRLPMLTWIMFLKFLDDAECVREEEATMAGEEYRATIEPPYRWRDWAAREEGITGDDLLRFVNQDEIADPQDPEQRIPGLFKYLRGLRGAEGGDRRDVVRLVFAGVQNRMINGYLLRDVVNLVNGIHFDASEEIHTLGALYETLLREMRDAAGDAGEFYTPRPVVRLMVQVVNPVLGETVLDPACGTGGFLSEAYAHLAHQAQTVEDRKVLQGRSILGGEAKPLPYLLGQMNLLLHGLDAPKVEYGNSLARPLHLMGEADRVDVILTNPPFGGEEEPGIQGNFPPDTRTSETALLFLQLIMRRLRRGRGRAAVVVPNGTLFAEGAAGRIKRQLVEQFNLHTIVRLPEGVFAPYTSIPTNLLFFDESGPTREVWYYAHPLPEGRRQYTKTKPLTYEELEPVTRWWGAREENERAWRVPVERIFENGYNLDVKNPNAKPDPEHLPPERLVASILEKERRIIGLLEEIRSDLGDRRIDDAGVTPSVGARA